jgi:site-specific DNA-methyltransferase (adenine-specific)
MIGQVVNGDCLEAMKLIPDKSIDMILTDPPYGIYSDKKATGFAKKRVDWGLGEWDKKVEKKYFDEMFRISKNQVIWGLNYYIDYLFPTKEIWVWDKKTGNNFFADGELAWTSFKGTLRIFRHQW